MTLKTWMVRAGYGGRFFERLKAEGIVGIGWRGVGDVSNLKTRDEFTARIRSAYPDYKDQQVIMSASQLFRFAREFAVGDRVVTYDGGSRRYLCGRITGPYRHQPSSVEEEFENIRAVEWGHEKLRDELSASARNSLGAISTIFLIPDFVSAELWSDKRDDARAAASADEPAPMPVEAVFTLKAVEESAAERIKDRLNRLEAHEMEQLVAGVLRGMGYRTWHSPKGKDRGADIIASPDGFGFQEPRIIVEVKHRNQQRMGAPEIRAFLGGRRPGDKGLFVSTGGFSNEARYEADRASIPLVLWDFAELTNTLLDTYDKLDAETRQLIPLKAVYWTLDE